MEQVEVGYIDDLMQGTEDWRVTDDGSADWAAEKVIAANKERDRLLAIADTRIKELQAKKNEVIAHYDTSTRFLTDKLLDYFVTVKTKDTPTQRKYKLLSGSLVLKAQQPEFIQDMPKMVEWAEKSAPEYIERTSKVKWGELKKITTLNGQTVVLTETGEVVQGITALARDPIFQVTE